MPLQNFDYYACLWSRSNDCEYGAHPARDWKNCDYLRVSNRAQTPGGGQHRFCRWTLYNLEVQLIEECGPSKEIPPEPAIQTASLKRYQTLGAKVQKSKHWLNHTFPFNYSLSFPLLQTNYRHITTSNKPRRFAYLHK